MARKVKTESAIQAEAFWIFASLIEPNIHGVWAELRKRGRRGIGPKRLKRWRTELNWDDRLEKKRQEQARLARTREGDFDETIQVMNLRIFEQLHRASEMVFRGLMKGAKLDEDELAYIDMDPDKAVRVLIILYEMQRRIRGMELGDERGGLPQNFIQLVMQLSVNRGAPLRAYNNRSGDGHDRLVPALSEPSRTL